MAFPDPTVDYRAHPECYEIGRGERGAFHVQPYKDELLPHWTIRTPELAQESADTLLARYERYRAAGDFVGMDMARKYLQMGYTRARRYANHRGGRKRAADGTAVPLGSGDPVKATIADIFRARWQQITADAAYQRLKAAHRWQTGEETPAQPTRPAAG
jgi:hypothetical protein